MGKVGVMEVWVGWGDDGEFGGGGVEVVDWWRCWDV